MTYKNFNESINQLFDYKGNPENRIHSLRRIGTVMFQVTEECNLRCTYCYEEHKKTSYLSRDMAKKECDQIITLLQKPDGILGYNNIDGLELQFIGGEPLLCTDLISFIVDYLIKNIYLFRKELIPFISINISTNGYNLLEEKIKNFILRYKDILFLTISIDGIQELHDKNRITRNGKGSFIKVFDSLCWAKEQGIDHIKSTFSKEDLNLISSSIIFFLEKGFRNIRYTGIYEDDYTLEDAKIFYQQQKIIADYILSHGIKNANVSLLDEKIGIPTDNKTAVCESCGDLICFTPNGLAYPCIRFTPTSLGFATERFCIGDYNCIFENDKKELYDYLKSKTAKTQLDQECLNCKIALGCGWCNAYCYKKFGSLDKRTKGNCNFHKARVLSCYYYQNKRSILFKDFPPMEINIDENEALKIIPDYEFETIKRLYDNAEKQFQSQKDNYKLIDFY